jgi:molybdopterin-guanine dinucleotide biosynthesis protein A
MPRTGSHFEPLTAIYPAEAAEFASQALARGEFSLQALAQKLLEKNRVQTYLLSGVERAYYHNANTPADLK